MGYQNQTRPTDVLDLTADIIFDLSDLEEDSKTMTREQLVEAITFIRVTAGKLDLILFDGGLDA